MKLSFKGTSWMIVAFILLKRAVWSILWKKRIKKIKILAIIFIIAVLINIIIVLIILKKI